MKTDAVEKPHSCDEAKARVWLSWTARGMQKNGHTVLLIEEIQPSWLRTCGQMWIYVILSRMLTGVVIGVIFASLIPAILLLENIDKRDSIQASTGGESPKPNDDYGSDVSGNSDVSVSIVSTLWADVGYPALWGLAAGLVLGLLDGFRLSGRGIWGKFNQLHIAAQHVINWLTTWLCVGSTLLLISSVVYWLAKFEFAHSLPAAILFVLVFGWITGRGTGRTFDNDIRTVETLGRDWREALVGGLPGAIGGFCFALFAAYQIGGKGMFMIVLPAVGCFVGAVFHGFRAKVKELKAVPNQGVVLSFQHAWRYGGSLGAICGFVWGFALWFDGVPVWHAALGSLLAGIGLGLTSAVWFGGLEVLRHYTLRLILCINGYTPLLYADFLDYAAERLIFLRKVGGGYMFIHRYLLEHFAEMEPSEKGSGGDA